ncbi:PKD domain-containing protein [Lentzea albidocapillata subsp. violacea]|uniref:PKD domain-containing protein n=1 Tax=Lentzea albidocapillata subsp. violacea TaxID=128104 RepID=A0A1G9QVZ4_9PSEU|nr:PKD domain-containing protein [Lentzea albidocapillata]SDM15164.1 PKD domain-containing protein [Lentzea albidocapillata subsp. violacea]
MKPRHVRILLAVVAALTGAIVVGGPGYETSQARMYSGAVWLASERVGQATLVDGASAEVKAQVAVGDPSTALNVTQQGDAALVLNEKTGALRRVDSATEEVSPPVSVLPASDGLVVLLSPDAPRVIDVHSGMTTAVDPVTLAPTGEPEHLADRIRPGSGVVDGEGRVWAIDDETGDVVWLSKGKRRVRAAATGNGRLAITRGLPVLVDPEHGTVQLIHPESGGVSRSLRPELRPDDDVIVSGSPGIARVLIVVPSRGELITCAFDAGSCAAPVKVAAAGADLGALVEADNYAVVPDHSTGQVTIVDLGTSRVVAQRRLFDQPIPFELVTRDDIVFFNDPEGNKAGVLDLWGDVRTITKYADDPATPALSLVPESKPSDDVQQTGRQRPDAGLGLPGLTGDPSQRIPGPAASILVKPGNRGAVGDEFELSFVLRPAVDATVRWSFGDGADASGLSVRHRWTEPGTFTVRATATFSTGKRAEAETRVVVDPPDAPPAITALDIRRPKPVIGESVRFSADTTRDPDRWEWTVTRSGRSEPEVTARTAEFAHAFAAAGRYVVTLTITKGSRTAQSSRQFSVGRGAVKGWGDEDKTLQSDIPEEAESGVIAIDAGENHSVALKADGRVIAWGDDTHGQLKVPSQALSGVIAISAGAAHSLALKADGSVIQWGRKDNGERDVPDEAQHSVVAISAGQSESMALKNDGRVIVWGGAQMQPVPEAVTNGVVGIEVGNQKFTAWKADGSIIVWPFGEDAGGRLDGGVRAAGWSDSVTLALGENGSVTSWGFPMTSLYFVPEAAKSGVVALNWGRQHVLALKEDATMLGWGLGYDFKPPPPPEYNRGVMAVAAGEGFTLVLLDGID